MFRDRVKEMAVNHPDMKAAEILANVEMLMGNPGPLGLKDESLMRSFLTQSRKENIGFDLRKTKKHEISKFAKTNYIYIDWIRKL